MIYTNSLRHTVAEQHAPCTNQDLAGLYIREHSAGLVNAWDRKKLA